MIWHAADPREIFFEFKTTQSGLNFDEAKKRLAKYGQNKLPEEKRLTWIQIFLSQFKSPLVYILAAAALITLLLGDFIDTGVILAAVFLNAFVGFFEEKKAEKTIEKLKLMLVSKAKVVRDGGEREINAEEVVPGDIILIEAGDKIPADARLLEARNLQIVEAALTGEAMPSDKSPKFLEAGAVLADRENMVYMGTSVIRGRGEAVVVSTGKNTELGKIALLVHEAAEEITPLQNKLSQFAKLLTAALSGVCFVIFLLGLLQGRSFIEMLMISVAAAVAAVPEGLLVTVTVILAVGMQRILREKALVRKLVAAETLGSTSIICTDKTGTLTIGQMMVDHIFTETQSEKTKMKALEIGLICNNAVIENPEDELRDWTVLGDSTEQALLLAAVQAGLDKDELHKEWPRIDEIPFDEEKKYMAVLCRNTKMKNKNLIYAKGAPERIMPMCSWLEINGEKTQITHDQAYKFKKEADNLANKGLRLLAIAYQEVGLENINDQDLNGLTFVGLIALKDPLRPEAGEAIKLCREAGIRPILVTGDHRLTAKTVGQGIGLDIQDKNILEGDALDKISDEELNKILKNIDIYARVEPRHKMRIIDAWQKRGMVVAMTGDGVNDAPALKKADVGVALGSGTEVAKEAADIILLDNNFKAIVGAVKQGRIVFDNIRKVILYIFSSIFNEIMLIIGSLIFGLPLPILAAQILWINLIEDSPPSMALAFDLGEDDIMTEKPRGRDEPIINLEMKILIAAIGVFTILFLFGIFRYFWQVTQNLDYARTIVFVGLGINSLLYIFSCRTMRRQIWQVNIFKNKFLYLAFVFGVLMLAVALYLPFMQRVLKTVPLGLSEWTLLISFGILNIILIEVVKHFFIVRGKGAK